jgi:hypothetical protein
MTGNDDLGLGPLTVAGIAMGIVVTATAIGVAGWQVGRRRSDEG